MATKEFVKNHQEGLKEEDQEEHHPQNQEGLMEENHFSGQRAFLAAAVEMVVKREQDRLLMEVACFSVIH
jgi:hypothetical protein